MKDKKFIRRIRSYQKSNYRNLLKEKRSIELKVRSRVID